MSFKTAPRRELRDFFTRTRHEAWDDPEFEYLFAMIKNRFRSNLRIIDLNVPRSDRPRAEIVDLISPTALAFYWSRAETTLVPLSRTKPLIELYMFMEAMCELALVFTEEDRIKGVGTSRGIEKQLKSLYCMAKAANERRVIPRGRFYQQLRTVLGAIDSEYPPKIRELAQTLKTWKPKPQDSLALFETIADLHAGYRQLRFHQQASTKRLGKSFLTLGRFLDRADAIEFGHSLCMTMSLAGYKLASNVDTWVDRIRYGIDSIKGEKASFILEEGAKTENYQLIISS